MTHAIKDIDGLKPAGPRVHRVDDGRPPRKVFVDGKEVARAIYADTEEGIVFYLCDHHNGHNGQVRGLRGDVLVGRIKA